MGPDRHTEQQQKEEEESNISTIEESGGSEKLYYITERSRLFVLLAFSFLAFASRSGIGRGFMWWRQRASGTYTSCLLLLRL